MNIHISNKRYAAFLFLIMLFYAINGAAIGNAKTADRKSLRERHVINREWKFLRADAEMAYSEAFIDSDWSDVHLPHSFSIPYFMHKTVYHGYGWYRKHFDVPASWIGKHVEIEFEGAFIEAEIYVNGHKAGSHVGGYTGFSIDITPYIRKGQNLVAVRVNNLWRADVAPRAGDHQFSGGIYRDVYLTVTNPLHVDWCGTFFSSSAVSTTSATVKATTTVRNDDNSARIYTLKTDIYSPDGRLVASCVSPKKTINPRQAIDMEQQFYVDNPSLWSIDSPMLYTAVTTISCGKKAIDTYHTQFGIRSMEWTADKGFLLNGQKLFLRGVNVHQDRAGWGDAATNAAFVRDVQMIKDAGFNFIRGSHYPHDPAFLHACDSIGIVYLSENAFWGMGGGGGDRGNWATPPSSAYPTHEADQTNFEASVVQQLKEMIRIHRNSPSVSAWSLCNEAFFSDRGVMPKVRQLLNRATDSVSVWDPSRQVGIGGCQRQDLDKLGKNQVAFYNGDGAKFSRPDVPNMVSEYGSRSMWRPGQFRPGWGDIGMANSIDSDAPQWRSGQAIWCGFDHGTVGGTGLATMGIIDYFRLPKRPYFWYKACYADGEKQPKEPVWRQPGIPSKLIITADKTSICATDGTDDVMISVAVADNEGNALSNEVPVTLTIVSGPGEFPTGRSISFLPPDEDNELSDISIRDGQCAIDFRSYHAGTTIIEASSPNLTSARISIHTKGTPKWKEGVSQPAPVRPYHRYKAEAEAGATSTTLAQNRPCFVSSNASQRMALNDGNAATMWTPAIDDSLRTCTIDLEATYSLSLIEIVFSTAAAHRFILETSADSNSWQSLADHSRNAATTNKATVSIDKKSPIRFVRVKLLSESSSIAEINISGIAY